MLGELLDAALGRLLAAHAFELERLGHDADGQDALLLRRPGDDGCSTRTGAAAHAGGDEGHMGACEMVEDFGQRLLGGGGTDLRLRSGTQPLRQGCTHLNATLRGVLHESLRIGVGDDELDPLKPALDHVVDGIAAGTSNAENGDAGLEIGEVRNGQIDGHFAWRPELICPLTYFLPNP